MGIFCELCNHTWLLSSRKFQNSRKKNN